MPRFRKLALLLPTLLVSCWGNPDKPPVINSFTASTLNLNACQELSLNVSASDPENKALSYTFAAEPKIGRFEGFGPSRIWALSPSLTTAQTVKFTVTVSDTRSAVASNVITVKIAADSTARNCGGISGTVEPVVKFASLPGYENAEFVPNEAIVRFKTDQKLDADSLGVSPSSTIAARAQSVGATLDDWITNDTVILKRPGSSAAVARAQSTDGAATLAWIAQLQARADVLYAEPNTILKAQGVNPPNDPRYKDQWHYPAIALPQAWNEFASEADVGAGVTVAVIDSGLLWDSADSSKRHSDFNCEVAPGEPKVLPGYDFINNTSNAFDTDTLGGFHGTHVAGTVGACSNNGLGVAGVAWKSQILPIKGLNSGSGNIANIAKAMYWAAGIAIPSGLGSTNVPNNPNPAQVINMSLGGQQAPSQILQDAVNAVNTKGVVVVVASGNQNLDTSEFTPANLQGVIAVGAVGPSKARASYSNFGSMVTIMAPGGDFSLRSTASDGILSTLGCGADGDLGEFHNPVGGELPPCPTFGYGSFHGTSMASPHVAGVVALMMSRSAALRSGNGSTWAKVRSYLMDASSPTGLTLCEVGCGAGLLDAQKAVQLATANGSIGPVLVREDASAVNLYFSGAQAEFTIKNIGDTAANGTIGVVGAGLSLVDTAAFNLAANASKKILVNLDRTNLTGRYAGRISIAYGGRQFQERIYYQGESEPLASVKDYFVRIYKKNTGGAPRQRLNYPDAPLQPSGGFRFPELEPGTYDITVYHSTGINADGTVNVDELGEARSLVISTGVLENEVVSLNRVAQVICSREGTLEDGPTKCPGTP
jgi:serine protease